MQMCLQLKKLVTPVVGSQDDLSRSNRRKLCQPLVGIDSERWFSDKSEKPLALYRFLLSDENLIFIRGIAAATDRRSYR